MPATRRIHEGIPLWGLRLCSKLSVVNLYFMIVIGLLPRNLSSIPDKVFSEVQPPNPRHNTCVGRLRIPIDTYIEDGETPKIFPLQEICCRTRGPFPFQEMILAKRRTMFEDRWKVAGAGLFRKTMDHKPK